MSPPERTEREDVEFEAGKLHEPLQRKDRTLFQTKQDIKHMAGKTRSIVVLAYDQRLLLDVASTVQAFATYTPAASPEQPAYSVRVVGQWRLIRLGRHPDMTSRAY